MTDPAGTTTYTYDNLNRLQTVTRNGTTITYAYDAVGNITDIIYPNNQHLTYTYNELNLPATVSDGTKINRVTYDEAAQPVQETMPNGVVVDYEFDECGRLTLLENKRNQNIIAKSAYTYDKNGNRLSYADKNGKTTTYAYDALNQLEEVGGNKLSQYIYDSVGNRKNVSETVNEEKLMTGIYLYDFDYEDRLIKAEKENETIIYTYDGDGTLVKKTVTSGSANMTYEYFYDYTAGLPRLLVEKGSDGTNYNYLYFGGMLYGRTGSEGTVYYHHDGLGSVVAITNANGNILNEYTYEAFGEPNIIQETVENSIMFTGEPYDQSGFVYLRARYYDPTAGRFVSSDKYKGEIVDPGSQNRYAYCANNPVNYVDPSGFDSYIFYEKKDWEGQAESLKKVLGKKYGSPVHMKEIKTEDEFVREWRNMGKTVDDKGDTKDVKIEGVVLIFHGSPHTININADSDEYLTVLSEGKTPKGFDATYIGNLDKKEIDELLILSCNAGHLDHYDDNVAMTFRKHQNINAVIGCDGNVAFSRKYGLRSWGFGDYIPRLSGVQKGFYENLVNGYRKPYGFVVY